MSKMSNIHLEIRERLSFNETPEKIAKDLNIPVTWVYATQELEEEQNDPIDDGWRFVQI